MELLSINKLHIHDNHKMKFQKVIVKRVNSSHKRKVKPMKSPTKKKVVKQDKKKFVLPKNWKRI